MSRTIVLLGGNRDCAPILLRARDMGLYTIVLDADAGCACAHLADEFVLASCYHSMDAIGALHRDLIRPNAVISAGTDTPHVMAAIANHFGIPGLSPITAERSRNKLLQAQTFMENEDINIPEYAPKMDAVPFVAGKDTVVKPIDSRGSRGVIRKMAGDMFDESDLLLALSYSRRGELIVQDWIDGIQISSESIVVGGKLMWTSFTERIYDTLESHYPHVVERGGVTPVQSVEFIKSEYAKQAEEQLQLCVDALELERGTLKGDLVFTGDKTYVIEVAARLSGGGLCSQIIPKVWGVDFVGIAIRLALGEMVYKGEFEPFQRGVVYQEYPLTGTETCHQDRERGYIIGFGPDYGSARRNYEMLQRLSDDVYSGKVSGI